MSDPEALLDLEQQLLAGCVVCSDAAGHIPADDEKQAVSNMDLLATKVPQDQWTDTARSLFNAFYSYRSQGGGCLTEEILIDMLTRSGASAEVRVKYHTLFLTLQQVKVPPAKFKYCLEKFREN